MNKWKAWQMKMNLIVLMEGQKSCLLALPEGKYCEALYSNGNMWVLLVLHS
jgi:hypothetical protein